MESFLAICFALTTLEEAPLERCMPDTNVSSQGDTPWKPFGFWMLSSTCSSPTQKLASPSELSASPSELLASPSELLMNLRQVKLARAPRTGLRCGAHPEGWRVLDRAALPPLTYRPHNARLRRDSRSHFVFDCASCAIIAHYE